MVAKSQLSMRNAVQHTLRTSSKCRPAARTSYPLQRARWITWHVCICGRQRLWSLDATTTSTSNSSRHQRHQHRNNHYHPQQTVSQHMAAVTDRGFVLGVKALNLENARIAEAQRERLQLNRAPLEIPVHILAGGKAGSANTNNNRPRPQSLGTREASSKQTEKRGNG